MKKYYLIFCILLLKTFTMSQTVDKIVLTSNYNGYFALNLQENRFCFFKYGFFFGQAIRYSKGNLKLQEDTIVFESDYDQMRFPFDVKSNYDKQTNSIFVVNFGGSDSSLYYNNLRSKSLFIIINEEDTISLKNDTIVYSKEVKSFYIQNLGQSYKTENFENKNNDNLFKINYKYREEQLCYEKIKGKIILKGKEAIVKFDNELDVAYLFNKIKYRKFKKRMESDGECPCWDLNKSLNFKKEDF